MTKAIVEDEEERDIVDRAMKFILTPIRNARDARARATECKIIWQRVQYIVGRGKYGITRFHPTLRPTRSSDAFNDLRNAHSSLVRRIDWILELRAGKEGSGIFPDVEEMRVLARRTAIRGSLPANVLVNYALALLSNPTSNYYKLLRPCAYCGGLFVPIVKPNRPEIYHSECKKKKRKLERASNSDK